MDDPDKMYDAISARNSKHFSQADHGTWTTQPLDATKNFEAMCAMADQILEGSFNSTDMNLDQTTQWIIDRMRRDGEANIVDHVISEEELR